MTRQQAADAAENAVVSRLQTRRALAQMVAEAEHRCDAEFRLELALRLTAVRH